MSLPWVGGTDLLQTTQQKMLQSEASKMSFEGPSHNMPKTYREVKGYPRNHPNQVRASSLATSLRLRLRIIKACIVQRKETTSI
eukprot:181263-Amphidinium_carterae.2